MSKWVSKIKGLFSSRTLAGVDKAGNRYFSRTEQIDGMMKEKRIVIFKGEEDPTSLPVEWICWLSGQRKKAPTPEEMIELEAKRERVKMNVAMLKKEEEKRILSGTGLQKSSGKIDAPDLKSFIQQFRDASFEQTEGNESETITDDSDEMDRDPSTIRTTEPTGSGASFTPGTWQPPS
ncbi:mimitin, mitochondrial isoform X1 [Amborella trichopoda]|uniref:mimitin, mitochondrial isoform X1 n=1 Tax=Amborella trichopoda TaxID=13333 RepID=UPI0005D3351B|nr:mimitin, mitochondrial isoform X1 [Amborella trichopoda]|eukprot:XP_011620460.1 mimitin, mitochondrial isoform X1 [Amborella trichopoda]